MFLFPTLQGRIWAVIVALTSFTLWKSKQYSKGIVNLFPKEEEILHGFLLNPGLKLTSFWTTQPSWLFTKRGEFVPKEKSIYKSELRILTLAIRIQISNFDLWATLLVLANVSMDSQCEYENQFKLRSSLKSFSQLPVLADTMRRHEAFPGTESKFLLSRNIRSTAFF